MKKHKKLYQKYITNECDDSEGKRMSETLEQFNLEHDENESLQDFDGHIDADLSKRLLTNIQYEIIERRKIRRRKAARVFGIVLVFGLVIGLTRYNKLQDSLVSTDTFLENRTTFSNNSDTIAVLNLPDQSIVHLMPNSYISYNASFNNRQRNIFLNGEAVFKVSKDPSKPFNVFSGQIVTTAIGTEFKVVEHKKNIFVKLLEGKIVVRKNNAHSDRHFLVAGNSINYNIEKDLFTSILRTAKQISSRQVKAIYTKKATAAVAMIKLDNEPLANALDLIAQKYGVEIEYSPLDVENINIIATIDASKPVYHILHNIALMNHLEVLEVADRQYILDKAK